eukprot:g978.t1
MQCMCHSPGRYPVTAAVLSILSLVDGDMAEAVTYISVVNVVATPYQALAFRNEKKNWKLIILLIAPMFASIWIGVELLFLFDSVWLKRAAGCVFLTISLRKGYVMWSSNRRKGVEKFASIELPEQKNDIETEESPKSNIEHEDEESLEFEDVDTSSSLAYKIGALTAGTFSGLLRGLIGAGGPPLMVFVDIFDVPKQECRIAVSYTLFFMEPLRSFLLFYVKGQFDSSRWYAYLLLGMTALSALEFGNRVVAPRVRERTFKMCVLGLLTAGSALMVTAETPASTYLAIAFAACLVVPSWYFLAKRLMILAYSTPKAPSSGDSRSEYQKVETAN